MTSRRWVIASLVCGALTIGSARADTSIKGLVLNSEGKPVPGAEVRAERLDHLSAKRAVTTTDAGGRYVFNNLPTGPYTVTVIGQNGAKSAPMTTYSTDNSQPSRRFISAVPYQLRPDFDSRAFSKDSKLNKRWVWKPGETGSHIGGQWIKAEDANMPSTNPLEMSTRTPSLKVYRRQ